MVTYEQSTHDSLVAVAVAAAAAVAVAAAAHLISYDQSQVF